MNSRSEQSQLEQSLLQQTEQPVANRNPEALNSILKQLSQLEDDKAITRVINLYKESIKKLEKKFWEKQPATEQLRQYQNAFHVLEKLHELKTEDHRHNFKIVIPVADRPQHLKQCLDSLQTLCRLYQYGGFKNNHFDKISVLIADDSKHANNIKLHKRYCDEIRDKGIDSEYFGLEEQLALLNSTENKSALSNIVSNAEDITEPADFSHKGASIMRNITYLKLKQCLNDKKNLIYFIDSDQEFCINEPHSDGNSYAINYFHYLNEIFTQQEVSIVTGKVVGDPPVSPSVMAANFQQDIKNFLEQISRYIPSAHCQFHQQEKQLKDEAAYHDMANLFGFANKQHAFDYHCDIKGKHENADCFTEFASKLARFFYGEHPTRKTYFNYGSGFNDTSPARTVYTGNYVIRAENLNDFIPFANLKLRMAGPVLGRLLKKRLQSKFVTANLPMLHNRTIKSIGRSEYRAGVDNSDSTIDLGDEFIRQFYGDIMLFSIEKITSMGYPEKNIEEDDIRSILLDTYQKIRHNYIDKHVSVLKLRSQIERQLKDLNNWWNRPANETSSIRAARNDINIFLKNIQQNFSEDTRLYQQITSQKNAQSHLDKMLASILQYRDDIDCWKTALRQ